VDAESLFRDGKLQEAITAQLNVVKKSPTDIEARFFLAELLAFRGDWERVDRQLETIINQSSKPPIVPLLFRQLVRAEIIREQVFAEGRAPEVVVELDEFSKLQLEIATAVRLGHTDDFKSLVDQSEICRPIYTGSCNSKPFSLIQDVDDRLRGIAEVLTATGKYFWIPWHSFRSLEFTPPEGPMDLIWRKAVVEVDGGPDGEVFIPSRYPSPNAWTVDQCLARSTDWIERDDAWATGVGQRLLLIEDEGVPVMELSNITLNVNTIAN